MLGSREPFPQRFVERVVLNHIAKRFPSLLSMVETYSAQMASVRYFDAVNRAWRKAEFIPYAERFE